MTKRFDPNRPHGVVYGSDDGTAYEQDGAHFDAHGGEVIQRTPTVSGLDDKAAEVADAAAKKAAMIAKGAATKAANAAKKAAATPDTQTAAEAQLAAQLGTGDA